MPSDADSQPQKTPTVMGERPRAPFALYLITDRRFLHRGETLGSAIADVLLAVPPGTVAVQLREKDLSDRDLLHNAEELREVTQDFGALLFINGRADIAVSVGADGVHLGWDAPPPRAIRDRFPGLKVGVSCHAIGELTDVTAAGADFATFSPVFQTSKSGLLASSSASLEPPQPHGLQGLTDAARRSRIPLVALGGVRIDSVRYVRDADVRSAACISAVMSAADRGAMARSLVEVLLREDVKF